MTYFCLHFIGQNKSPLLSDSKGVAEWVPHMPRGRDNKLWWASTEELKENSGESHLRNNVLGVEDGTGAYTYVDT